MNISSQCPTDAMIYTPAHLAAAFPEHRLVVRSDDPLSFLDYITAGVSKQVDYLQLTDFNADPSPLMRWESVFPLDVMMTAPWREFPRLYVFAPLLDRGPVRVSIPAVKGVEEAVKLAAALHFNVNVIPGQPDAFQVAQLIRLADYYLKNPTIEAPIEFFHSLFFAFVNGDIATLWEILEKDPSRCCFVTDEGGVNCAENDDVPFAPALNRPMAAQDPGRPRTVNRFSECTECRFRPWCLGFFKYPDPGYSCLAVLPLFEHLLAAAEELKQDLAAGESAAP